MPCALMAPPESFDRRVGPSCRPFAVLTIQRETERAKKYEANRHTDDAFDHPAIRMAPPGPARLDA